MKLGLFSDAHYSSRDRSCGVRRNRLALDRIKKAYAFFSKHGCDLCVFLGDMIDKDESRAADVGHLAEIREVIDAYGIETVFLMGNHDAFAVEKDEYYAILGGKPEDRSVDGKRLIFLDTCYFRDGRPYTSQGGDWTDCFLPDDGEFIKLLSEGNGETFVFLHHCIDPSVPNDHRLANADRLFAAIGGCGRVKTVFQGHYHPGKRSVYGGVSYVTLPALCENENAFFAFDI